MLPKIDTPPEQFAEKLKGLLATGVLEAMARETHYTQFQDDPVGFGGEVLGNHYTKDVQRMMESVRDNPVTVAVSANGVGKTFAAADVSVWWYRAFPESQVYSSAAPPESNLKKLLWGEIGQRIEKHKNLFSSDTITNLHIQRSAKSFLTGVAIPSSGTSEQREAKFSGKHSPYLLFILDEGDAIPDEVYRGIDSCMSGGHARLLVMYNPRSALGEAYRMQRDGRANVVSLSAFNHPNVITGEDKIPGAVTRETTVRRINQWCRPFIDGELDEDCFMLPEFLEGVTAKSQSGEEYPPLGSGKYKIVDSAFSYMVLGKYPAQSSQQLISREWTSKARARYDAYVKLNGQVPPQFTRCIAGLDVAEDGKDMNVLCRRYGGYIEPLKAWSGMDVISTGDRAGAESTGADRINVDATGVGSGVAPHMQREGFPAISVKVAKKSTEKTELGEFYILRDQLLWAVREWLRKEDAMLPPDEMLVEELLAPTYKVEGGKIRTMGTKTMKELLKRSPDRLMAVAMSFYSGGFFSESDLT